MKYFFVLGNNPTLSLAELSAFFDIQNAKIINKIAIINFEKEIDVKNIIKKLGGVIKIGIIQAEVNHKNKILPIVKKSLNLSYNGKYKYGFSYYGKNNFNEKPIAMETKKFLKEHNVSCRWITSKEAKLSSVIVEQNKLTTNGIEMVFIEKKFKIYIGKTLAVQPFKDLSYRDYGRPARDDKSGMLPPKLAQIMINLSKEPTQNNPALLDPFCGSGTVLTEAMIMGYDRLTGSDLSKKAIDDSGKNIRWIVKKYNLKDNSYKLLNSSVIELSTIVPKNSIDVVVTEPYLGPQRGRLDIKAVTKELETLYSKALKEFDKILKKEGKIVILWPIFILGERKVSLSPNINNFKIISPLPEELLNKKNIKLTDRNTIIYGRDGQRVWREIVILKKS